MTRMFMQVMWSRVFARPVPVGRHLLRALLWCVALPFIAGTTAQANPISTVGLNLSGDSPEFHPFWKACGYDTVELLDIGWWGRPDQHASYYANVAGQIQRLHQDGFKVYVILLANMQQWTGPAASAPGDYLGRYNPADAIGMQTRLDYLRDAITPLQAADGFVFFAGDPGGNAPEFNTTVEQFNAMCRQVRSLVYTHGGPQKDFIINSWAISYWVDTPTSAYTRQLWDEQIAGTRTIVEAADLLGALTGAGGKRTGIAFATDNYYRPLALTTYAAQPSPTMEFYPLAATTSALAQRSVPQQWGWPYFLLDEADGGYASVGQAQSELRYIRQYVESARAIGLNGVIGNLSYAGRAAEVLNTYALARFCLPTTATVTQASVDDVFGEFSAIMATSATSGLLNQVLRYLENTSTWHASRPIADRLAPVNDGLTLTAWRALMRLRQVQPQPFPSLALPEPPRIYLRRLHTRLETLAAAEGSVLSQSVDLDGGELFGLEGANWAGDATTAGGMDAGLGTGGDRATLVVSSDVSLTGFPGRVDRPLHLRRTHAPASIRLGIRKNPLQTATGFVFWDDVLLGTINAQASGEFLASVELPVPDVLRQRWSAFTQGPHLLTIEVPAQTGLQSYLEVDALWLADTPRFYHSGFTWELTSDYAPETPLLSDVGSVNLAANTGLSRAAPGAPPWLLGYVTVQPFNPANMTFNPAQVAPLSTQTQMRGYGEAHVEPGQATGAEIGEVTGNSGAALGCVPYTLYLRGRGSLPVPQLGTSVSPAVVAFQAPQSGTYAVRVRLKGRTEGWHAAANFYRGAQRLGTRQTIYNGQARAFDFANLQLSAGETLYLLVEGMTDANWSEVLLEQFQVQLVRSSTSAAQSEWTHYADDGGQGDEPER